MKFSKHTYDQDETYWEPKIQNQNSTAELHVFVCAPKIKLFNSKGVTIMLAC